MATKPSKTVLKEVQDFRDSVKTRRWSSFGQEYSCS